MTSQASSSASRAFSPIKCSKRFIFDVVVDPAHRGRALGRQLMERILSDPRLARVKHFELYCLPELEPFYQRLGFSADVGGVRLMRLTRYSL